MNNKIRQVVGKTALQLKKLKLSKFYSIVLMKKYFGIFGFTSKLECG